MKNKGQTMCWIPFYKQREVKVCMCVYACMCMYIFVSAHIFIKNSWAYSQENNISGCSSGICRTQWLMDTVERRFFSLYTLFMLIYFEQNEYIIY